MDDLYISAMKISNQTTGTSNKTEMRVPADERPPEKAMLDPVGAACEMTGAVTGLATATGAGAAAAATTGGGEATDTGADATGAAAAPPSPGFLFLAAAASSYFLKQPAAEAMRGRHRHSLRYIP